MAAIQVAVANWILAPGRATTSLLMRTIDEILASIPVETPERPSAPLIVLDLVGAAEAAQLLGIGRAALWERRRAHANFPSPVAGLRCGPVWFRWQIQAYRAEEERLGRRGWYGRRLGRSGG